MKFAGFWIRVGAFLVDVVLIVIFGIIIFEYSLFSATVEAYIFWFSIILYIFLLPLTKLQGTIGKVVFGLRIVSSKNGQRIKIWQAVVRGILLLLQLVIRLLFLVVAFHKEKQGLHDLAAKTYVIKVNHGKKEVIEL
ncbi:RDD family protein [Bacillus changyiensis]|uniref:RDD family protein n=1 Tax=Bacillus changyiensis TaxID=3004103 RepID=UPI0022E3A1EC|nr:RDD family protein [Bacillus changyiensis]MDA1477947.1 RDD family protein [Bacillus changyiensis]